MYRTIRARVTYRRTAAAVVEMALVTPLLLMILMGIIEFGWLFHVKSSLTTASRLGARAGSLPGATINDVEAAIDDMMSDLGFTTARYPSYDYTITLATTDNPYVTVEVVVDYQDVSLVGGFFRWLDFQQLRGITTLLDENAMRESE